MKDDEHQNLIDELASMGSTGLDGSPGDPVCRQAAGVITYLLNRVADLEDELDKLRSVSPAVPTCSKCGADLSKGLCGCDELEPDRLTNEVIYSVMGWQYDKENDKWVMVGTTESRSLGEMPNYLHDLNAMRQAESVFIGGKHKRLFADYLRVLKARCIAAGLTSSTFAGARQRAEAMVEVILNVGDSDYTEGDEEPPLPF